MIYALIETYLGPIGAAALHFYQTNALPINSVVVLYGLVIVLSWTNLVSIRKRLVGSIAAQILQNPDLHAGSKAKRVLKEVSIPWQEAIDDVRFPLVARQSAFWPKRKSIEAVQTLLPAEDLAEQALELLAKQPPSTSKTA
jgi:hypothetical protein